MNFFDKQEEARRRTSHLVGLYALAVACIVLFVYTAASFILSAGLRRNDSSICFEDPGACWNWWNPNLFLGVAALTLAVILIGTAYKLAVLSQGGEHVARRLGGRPLSPQTTDAHERRLINVIDEMAIASGTPVPAIFVLDHEEGINAFAAGFSLNDAVIGVTSGCMRLLSRDEFQGVIAHEFSHILNGDMRLNLRLIGVLHGILLLALIGRVLTEVRGSHREKREGGGGAIVAMGIALFIIGYVGVFFAHLIKSAVSRQREFLADASAVQFTRQTTGIGGALKKIGGLVAGSKLDTPRAEEASHMYFANGLKRSFFALLATHPPLKDRIKRLDPAFDGVFPEEIRLSQDLSSAELGFAPSHSSNEVEFHITPDEVVSSVGTVSQDHLAHASHLIETIPYSIRESLTDPRRAEAVIIALLHRELDAEMSNEYLGSVKSPEERQSVIDALKQVAELGAEYHLLLVELAIPALRRLPSPEFRSFMMRLSDVAILDRSLSLFEYCLLTLLDFAVARSRDQRITSRPKGKLEDFIPSVRLLLSGLAYYGHSGISDRAKAFEIGARALPVSLMPLHWEPSLLPTLDKALDDIAHAPPKVKEQVIAACVAAVSADGVVTLEESELLRVVCACFECPIPPFLNV